MLRTAAQPLEISSDETFRQCVWRQIRHREALGGDRLFCLADLGNLFLAALPRLAAGGAVIATVVGIWIGTMAAPSPKETRSSSTFQALDLQVFDPHAEGLALSNLLAKQ